MGLNTIKNLVCAGKHVLMRVDFNVPLKDGVVTDDTRIEAAIPSIEYLTKNEAKLILVSHLGRPKGEKNTKYSLTPIAHKLAQVLQKHNIQSTVKFVDDVIGESVVKAVNVLQNGEILLLENVRFYKEEEENDEVFSKTLASYADFYVNDAFGTSHRAHASTEGVAHFLPSFAGYLVEREVNFFEELLKNPKQPFVAIIGGAKVSSKIAVLESLLHTASSFVIGGGMAYTFLQAQGFTIGKSLIEQEYLSVAKNFLQQAAEREITVVLPVDHLGAVEFEESASAIFLDSIDIPDNYLALDIGAKTIEIIKATLSDAKTIVWNGPMGVFEFKNFEKGTLALANAIVDSNAKSVIGGGDSVAAANKFGLADKFSHVSTGGGASLEFLEGKILPGIRILQE